MRVIGGVGEEREGKKKDPAGAQLLELDIDALHVLGAQGVLKVSIRDGEELRDCMQEGMRGPHS